MKADRPQSENLSAACRVLTATCELFQKDDKGVLFLGWSFGSLKTSLSVNRSADQRHHSRASDHFHAISRDIWNVASLVERLEFVRQRALSDEEIRQRMITYAELDIGALHTQFRSIFDHIAQGVAEMSGNAGKLPDSFEKMINGQEKYRNALGPLAALFEDDFSWFSELRDIRTELVHRGREPMAFDVEKGEDYFLFQVHSRDHRGLVEKPIFMHNENVARLDRYVAYYFAHTVEFLERVACAVLDATEFKLPILNVKTYAHGFLILYPWLKELRGAIEAAEMTRGAAP